MPDLQLILLNIYYIGVAIAFLVKDILTLRIIMIIAGICMILQGFMTDNSTVIFWLSLFTVINLIQVIRILYENRGIKLIKDIENLYKKIFSDMTRKEFQHLWVQGEIVTVDKQELICKDGSRPEQIFLLIHGKCQVKKGKEDVALLERGNFIAEMGYLTGKEASADVTSLSSVTYICWTHKKLNRLKELYPQVHNKFHLIISKDLSEKLKKYL